MADPNTVTVAAGARIITGYMTDFMAAEGDIFLCEGEGAVVASRQGSDQLTLKNPWAGPTVTGSANFNIVNTGPYWQTPLTTNTLLAQLIRKFEAGPFKWDASGALSERSAYDNQGEDFAFLSVDPLPFRLYVKRRNTNSPSDWSSGQVIGAEGPVAFEAALTDERNQRVAADSDLSNRISAEVARAKAAEAELKAAVGGGVDAEVSRATAAEAAIDGRLTSEIARSVAADSALVTRVNLEGLRGPYIDPEYFGAKANNASFDNAPALQAMFNEQIASGRIPFLKPRSRYYCASRLNLDPSRMGLMGNNSIFDFSLKNFTNPATVPELLKDGEFNSGSPWIIGPDIDNPNNNSLSYHDGLMDWNPADGVHNYLSIGQQVPVVAGKSYLITIVVESGATRTDGINTFRTLNVRLAQGAINGGSGGTFRSITMPATGWAAGQAFTFEVAATVSNPFFAVNTSMALKLRSVSLKELPDNACMKYSVTDAGQGLRGHNYREWRNFKIAGRPDQASLVEGIVFDTIVSAFSSRVGFYNVDVSDGVGRGLLFKNRFYLGFFVGCRVVCTEACIETMAGAADAGENIAFIHGNLGGGKAGIVNRGMSIRLISTSIDFTQQFYTGVGNLEAVTCWFETNANSDPSKYYLDITEGTANFFGGLIQIDGSTVPVLDTPFRVAPRCTLDFDGTRFYNCNGTTDAWVSGGGRVAFGAGIVPFALNCPTIKQRDARHSRWGYGGLFEGPNIEIPCWVDSAAPGVKRTDARNIGFVTYNQRTATLARGSPVLTNLSSTQGLAIGHEVTGPGIQPGSLIRSIDSASQVTMTQPANGVLQQTVTFVTPSFGGLGMDISKAQARTGTQSLRLFRSGVGSGTSSLAYVAMPVRPGRKIGTEFWWKVPPVGSADFPVYFDSFFAALTDRGPDQAPLVSQVTEFATDQPKKISSSAGQDWTRFFYNTMQNNLSAGHDGWAPEWATHAIVRINLVNVPSGFEMFIDDAYGSEY